MYLFSPLKQLSLGYSMNKFWHVWFYQKSLEGAGIKSRTSRAKANFATCYTTTKALETRNI